MRCNHENNKIRNFELSQLQSLAYGGAIMKVSSENKMLLFEQEFTTFLFIVVLSTLTYLFQSYSLFYFLALAFGFMMYFWMLYEENVYSSGQKHEYFEHTSSFIMIGQTALALSILAMQFNWQFVHMLALAISIIMLSVSLSRILLFKIVFNKEVKY